MEILVVNLMRLADLIQTSPVLRRLRAEYPKGRITLLIMDIFKEPGLLLEDVDRVLLFPGLHLTEAMDGAQGWPGAYRQLTAWFEENLSPPPDLVVNLTPNLLGGIFSFATQAREVRGFAVSPERRIHTKPSWSSYSLIVSKARVANPYNLVDLFLRGAGLKPDGVGLQAVIPPQAQKEADTAIKALSLPEGTALVGLLPGASSPERQWPPENFARTAELLRKARLSHFFIFGSAAEAPLGEAIRRLLPPSEVTLCQGRTAISTLAGYLRRMDLLITNDTGPMHLAAAVGTPVLALFLATARVQDTGPVGPGHLALEARLGCHPCLAPCAHPHCHAVITPQSVVCSGLHILEKNPFGPLVDGSAWDDLRVYYSATDPLGYHVHLPLVRRPLTRKTLWLWMHRLVWADILDMENSTRTPLILWIKEVFSNHYLPPLDDLGITSGQQALMELLALAAQGEDLARQIVASTNLSPVRLWQKAEAFGGIDVQLRRLAISFPELASFIEFFFQEQRGHAESELVPLARELANAYHRLHKTGEICLEVFHELASTCQQVWKTETQKLAQRMQLLNEDHKQSSIKQEVTPCW